MELSVVLPCLNEADTLETCVRKAWGAMRDAGIEGEVIVADNGSTDGSPAIAERLGARVVHVRDKGYGAALAGGFEAARGRFVVMGDADDSYDFSELQPFVDGLVAGNDLVLGNRFEGGIAEGAMPALHRRFFPTVEYRPVLPGPGEPIDHHNRARLYTAGALRYRSNLLTACLCE